MSTRVLAAPMVSRRDGLQLGGHYRLPSGNTVVLKALAKGGVALCVYASSANSNLSRDDEVSFFTGWLERYGQLSWAG